jgi:2-methylisocitrate lyase-like PEP mutase family enzyme
VDAVAPKPVNALVFANFTTVAEMADIGVRRISVGGALARSAWTGFLEAAKEIAEQGTFTGFARSTPNVDLSGMFARYVP